MNEWSAWIGREDCREDRIDPGLLARWCAALDRPLPDGGPDDGPDDGKIPHGLHWCLCLPDAPTAALGADGHPRRDEHANSFLPPVPLPRRMWAASQCEFPAPLRLGEAVTRRSRIGSITAKSGASGDLVFIEVDHEISGERALAVRERQTLVYRASARPGAIPPPPPPPGEARFDPVSWTVCRELVPSEALLFRYSALTFNAHRIHYDLPYAQGEENYRGLVVHGPLTATLLLDLARRELGENALASFAFRAISPAICGELLHLVLRGKGAAWELGAFAADGREVMRAEAR